MFWNKKPEPVVTKRTASFYRIGLTDNNCVSLTLGDDLNTASQLIMNKKGCAKFIEVLTAFADALDEETQDEPEPNV